MVNFNIFKYKNNSIYSVVDGVGFPIDQVNDNIFSSKVLGDGIAIAPLSNYICSPCNGKITTLFPTGHAFGITRDDGVEILVHIGIDTVNCKGKGFKILKKQNQYVKKGEMIIEADFKYFSHLKIDSTVMIIITDLKGKKIETFNYGEVKAGKNEIISLI